MIYKLTKKHKEQNNFWIMCSKPDNLFEKMPKLIVLKKSVCYIEVTRYQQQL